MSAIDDIIAAYDGLAAWQALLMGAAVFAFVGIGINRFETWRTKRTSPVPVEANALPVARGGSVDIEGHHNVGLGGPPGESTSLGVGMPGGDVKIRGDGNIAAGGQGGGAPREDGKGGKGGKSGAHTYANFTGKPVPDYLQGYGDGGDGANKGDAQGKPGMPGIGEPERKAPRPST